MAERQLNKIFLSASIPTEDRDPQFYQTADVIAIRDAVRALATIVIPNAILVWGGHPAITPMIRYVIEKMNVDLKSHVTIYQSEFFRDFFPPDNFDFEDIRLVASTGERESSLKQMRELMIKENNFKAAIFIGGMDGIIEEYELFKHFHPDALILPVASTGAASRLVYDQIQPAPSKALLQNFAYMDLFKDCLEVLLK